jgi:hypothetical protein
LKGLLRSPNLLGAFLAALSECLTEVDVLHQSIQQRVPV